MSLRLVFAIFFLGLLCPVGASERRLDLSEYFSEQEGCFLLYDLTQGAEVICHNSDLANTRLSPCSTFKIPNAVIALDLGILDENTILPWDGTKHPYAAWEQDHTLASAIRGSVVWFFQEIARQVGKTHYVDYLERFDYGNRDFTSGIDSFWLGWGESLRISPKEQIDFLNRFYRDELDVSQRAVNLVKEMLILDEGGDWALSGKTGTSFKCHLGWFVGYLQAHEREYTFVTCLQGGDASGKGAKKLTEQILSSLGLIYSASTSEGRGAS